MEGVKMTNTSNGYGAYGPPIEPMYHSDYIKIFEFEKYDHTSWNVWMHKHWDISVYASALYVVLIFLGQHLMKNRQPFQIRKLLLAWNVSLALFSAIGFSRSFPELYYEWTTPVNPEGGIARSVCFVENHNIATSLWGLLFAFSKLIEFGDTAFIILKKQKLIFLHWYHHVTVSIYCWFSYSAYDPSNRWFCTANYFVHSCMYSYYSARVLHFKIPRNLPMCITILQITQMIMGVIINVYTYSVKTSGGTCDCPMASIYLAFGMYITYFILFANFFRKAYLKSGKSKTQFVLALLFVAVVSANPITRAKPKAYQAISRVQAVPEPILDLEEDDTPILSFSPPSRSASYGRQLTALEENEKVTDEQAQNAFYNFTTGYEDSMHDNSHIRQEERNGLAVKGSYSYSDGYFRRTVHYEADENGYRVVSEEVEPIGDGSGPVTDFENGQVQFASDIAGVHTQYSAHADEIGMLQRRQKDKKLEK